MVAVAENSRLGQNFLDAGSRQVEHDVTAYLHRDSGSLEVRPAAECTQDPIGFLGDDENLQRYVWNNPLSFTDPSGLAPPGTQSDILKDLATDGGAGMRADLEARRDRYEEGKAIAREGQRVMAGVGGFSPALSAAELINGTDLLDENGRPLTTGEKVERGAEVAAAAAPLAAIIADELIELTARLLRSCKNGKAIGALGDAADAAVDLSKTTKTTEPPQLQRGKRAHKGEPILPGETAEHPTPSGKRMDRYDPNTQHIREIKPNNDRAIKAGKKQVEKYKEEMEKVTGRPHTTEVSPYDPDKYK